MESELKCIEEKYQCCKCRGRGKIQYGSAFGDFTETCNMCGGSGKRFITITLREYDDLKKLKVKN